MKLYNPAIIRIPPIREQLDKIAFELCYGTFRLNYLEISACLISST